MANCVLIAHKQTAGVLNSYSEGEDLGGCFAIGVAAPVPGGGAAAARGASFADKFKRLSGLVDKLPPVSGPGRNRRGINGNPTKGLIYLLSHQI